MPALIPILIDEPAVSVRARGTITDHPKDTNATILSLTIASEPLFLDVVRADGNADAHYQLIIDDGTENIIEEQHSSIVMPTVKFEFPTPFIVNVGEKIIVKVEHYYVPLANFSAALFGHRKC